jgi:2-acylglycerol O-acyltransferase 2
VYIKKRKGFVRLALTKDVPLVPLYVFGTSDSYRTSAFLYGPRLWLTKTLSVCIPFAVGFLGSPFCPLPVKTTLVFGKPMQFPLKTKGSPTAEEVDIAHAKFVGALAALFDEYKGRFGYGDRSLEIE